MTKKETVLKILKEEGKKYAEEMQLLILRMTTSGEIGQEAFRQMIKEEYRLSKIRLNLRYVCETLEEDKYCVRLDDDYVVVKGRLIPEMSASLLRALDDYDFKGGEIVLKVF